MLALRLPSKATSKVNRINGSNPNPDVDLNPNPNPNPNLNFLILTLTLTLTLNLILTLTLTLNLTLTTQAARDAKSEDSFNFTVTLLTTMLKWRTDRVLRQRVHASVYELAACDADQVHVRGVREGLTLTLTLPLTPNP